MAAQEEAMRKLDGSTIVVAGGTGNVGTFIVGALLKHGATVVVPSRSQEKLAGLREHLQRPLDEVALSRLMGIVGDVGDEQDAARVAGRVVAEVGRPAGVVASLGRFLPAASLVAATAADLRQVLEGYTVAHFTVARTFLPGLDTHGGTYVFVNGPLAFQPWENSGAGLVSVATAAQQMLFRALSQERSGGPARVVELVSHAFLRDRQAQPGSTVPGEAVGEYVAHLLSGGAGDVHGRTIHLRSPDQLTEAGIELSLPGPA
jgi:NAD(P)-dependent dehydrogenase (short-subunit alcohol dehydrogenase family)